MKKIILSFTIIFLVFLLTNGPVYAFSDSDKKNDTVTLASIWYFDGDFDGYGDPSKSTDTLTNPFFWVPNKLDCDDSNEDINPEAKEIAQDGVDSDCDGGDTGPCIPITLGWVCFSDITVHFLSFNRESSLPTLISGFCSCCELS